MAGSRPLPLLLALGLIGLAAFGCSTTPYLDVPPGSQTTPGLPSPSASSATATDSSSLMPVATDSQSPSPAPATTPDPTVTPPAPVAPNVFRQTIGKGYLVNWLFHPEGVAAAGDDVLVADGNRSDDMLPMHGAWLRFGFDGQKMGLFDQLGGLQQLSPTMYGIATDGQVVYTLTAQGIYGFAPGTGYVLNEGTPMLQAVATSMAVCGTTGYVVVGHDVETVSLPTLAPQGTPLVFTALPGGVATDASGSLYVAAGGKVTVYRNGQAGLSFDGQGTDGRGPGFAGLVAVAVDPRNGDIYALDASSVLRFDAQGQYLTQFGGGRLAHPTGITVAGDGYVYVSDDGSDEVDQFTPGF